ncbi:MAG: YtxH domain-containing protein [Candidatus Binatia bacterium]
MRHRSREKFTTGNELFFFAVGVSVGVVAALLMAPYSGEETRQYLRERVDEGRDRAGDMLDRGKEFVERGRGSIGEAVGYGRKTFQEKI